MSGYWLKNPILHEYFATCMWNLKKHYMEYIVEKYGIRNATVLSIGCGSGDLERGLAKLGCAKAIEAFDIDKIKIEEARKLSKRSGLDDLIYYFQADANNIHLPKERYDLVVAHNSLHHIQKLEELFQEVKKH